MKMQSASQFAENAGVIAQATTPETIAGDSGSHAAIRPVPPTIRDVLKSPWWQTRILIVYDVLLRLFPWFPASG
jgi:hypothetical protein